MSAINVIRQRDRVVLVTDGAVWDVNAGIVVGFPTKAAAIPSWPGVLATRGNPLCMPLFAHFLGMRFKTFDEAIAGIEATISDIHAEVKRLCRNGDTDSPIVIAGWSHKRRGPEAYAIRLADDLVGGTVEETAEVVAEAIQPPKYKLTELGSITYAPFVKHEAYDPCGARKPASTSRGFLRVWH
jgi:hypothetical protein